MGITVYMSSASANATVKGQQRKILDYLSSHKIQYEEVDLSVHTDAYDVMTSKMPANKIPEKGKVQLPQVFNDDSYCGDYEMYFNAQEMEMMCTFFKIPLTEKEEKKLKEYTDCGMQVQF